MRQQAWLLSKCMSVLNELITPAVIHTITIYRSIDKIQLVCTMAGVSTAPFDHLLQCKAWVYQEQGPLPETLRSTSVSLDTRLGSNEVMVEVKAVGLNPVDMQLANLPQWIATWILAAGVRKAKVPGADFSGVIRQIGRSVTKYKIGDEVFGLNVSITGNGCLSQYIKLLETMPTMTMKPSGLSHVEAAAVPLVFLTAYTALHGWAGFTDRDEGDTQKVLILGASGGVGHIACQLARAMNKSIVATCSSRNIDFVRSLGVQQVIDYTTDDVVTASSRFGPYDAILDCVGGTQFIPHLNADLLKPHGAGYLTVVGDKTSRDALGGMICYLFNPAMILRSFKSLLGCGPRYYCINLSLTRENTTQMVRMLQAGLIRPTIDSVFGFREQVKQAYEYLDTGRVRGKVVIDFEK